MKHRKLCEVDSFVIIDSVVLIHSKHLSMFYFCRGVSGLFDEVKRFRNWPILTIWSFASYSLTYALWNVNWLFFCFSTSPSQLQEVTLDQDNTFSSEYGFFRQISLTYTGPLTHVLDQFFHFFFNKSIEVSFDDWKQKQNVSVWKKYFYY